MAFFDSISWVYTSLLFVVPSILISLLLLRWVRKKFPVAALRKHHDVAGFVFGSIGLLYSVILGFTVINVQTRYTEAEQIGHTEAMTLADLYKTAALFPDASRNTIRSSLRQYTQYVIEKEWQEEKPHSHHLSAQPIFEAIWNSYVQVPISDTKTSIWYTQSIKALDRLMDSRLARIFNAWEHLGTMMWTILLIGAFLTVCFMCFFSLENFRLQLIMTGALAGYLALMLFLVYSLDHVYQGPQAIQPVAFQEVLSLFDHWDER